MISKKVERWQFIYIISRRIRNWSKIFTEKIALHIFIVHRFSI